MDKNNSNSITQVKNDKYYLDEGEKHNNSGLPFSAYEILEEGVKKYPDNVRMRQQFGLALANAGATYRANEILQKLYDEGDLDEDTFGILARTHKDLWRKNIGTAQGDFHLLKSYMIYREGFEKTRGYYTAINAATMGLFLSKDAQKRAKELEETARDTKKASGENSGEMIEYESRIKKLIKSSEDYEVKSKGFAEDAKRLAFKECKIFEDEVPVILDTEIKNWKKLLSCLKNPREVINKESETTDKGSPETEQGEKKTEDVFCELRVKILNSMEGGYQKKISEWDDGTGIDKSLKEAVFGGLNGIINKPEFANQKLLEKVKKADPELNLPGNEIETLSNNEKKELNRIIIETALQGAIRKMKDRDKYWAIATMGEASVLMNKFEEAKGHYKKAVGLAKENWGYQNSSKKQLKLMSEIIPEAEIVLHKCFPVPKVVVFAGHMIDQKGRAKKRFPPEIEEQVKGEIRRRIKEWGDVEGFSSAACGSDILFLEVLREMGKVVNVVLPYNANDFCKDSVVVAGERWKSSYHNILDDLKRKREEKKPGELYIASDKKDEGSVSYENANMLLLGFATLRAHEIGAEIKTLTVWDGKPGDGPGGTSSIVSRWEDIGIKPEIIDPIKLSQPSSSQKTIKGTGKTVRSNVDSNQWTRSNPRVKAICYIEIVGLSGLSGSQLLDFDDEVMPGIRKRKYGYNAGKLFEYKNGEFLEFEGFPYFKTDEIRDWKKFISNLKSKGNPVIDYLRKFSSEMNNMKKELDSGETMNQDKKIEELDSSGITSLGDKKAIINELNKIIKKEDFYNSEIFNSNILSPECREMLEQGFESLYKEEIPLFNRLLIESIFKDNIMRNPYSSVRDAGKFALACLEIINKAKKEERDMPESLDIRIILHVCPISKCDYTTFENNHGSKFPEISKIPSHQVYATREFAAIASAYGIEDFTCELTKKTSSMNDEKVISIYALR